MSLIKLRTKPVIIVGLVLCLSFASYIAFFKKSESENSKKEITPASSQLIVTPAGDKKATVYKENLDQQSQLKALEFKVGEVRAKREKLLRLRTVIEGHIKLRQDLLKPAQDKISHFEKLQTEGALNDQDIELARSQLASIQGLIEKASKDKDKVTKLISDQEAELTKAETELKNFKSL